jgi:folate-dependent tRNA-U54 methylase TrmFO/GidA
MKANFGIFPPLDDSIKSKRQRAQEYSNRALADLKAYIDLNQPIFESHEEFNPHARE